MDKIIITDLRATGILGVKSPERDQAQTVLINLTLFTDLHKAGISDNIEDTVSYSAVAKTVLARVSETQYFTLEALAGDLATLLLNKYGIQAVSIRTEKPDFVAHTSRVGIEIFRESAKSGS